MMMFLGEPRTPRGPCFANNHRPLDGTVDICQGHVHDRVVEMGLGEACGAYVVARATT